MTPRTLAVLTTIAAMLGVAATASAAPGGVAYIKDGQVWVAKLDGSKKVQLSTGDAWWNAVGQSSSGGIVATKNEPGKIAQLTTFTVWNPDGTQKDFGPASPGLNFSGSLAFPLGLELTSDNRGIIFGYSHGVWNYGTFPATFSLERGYALLPTDTRATSALGAFTNSDVRWPSLVAGRLIGTPDEVGLALENAGGNNTSNFTAWPGLAFNGLPNASLHGVQIAESGQLLTAQIDFHDANNAAADDAKVDVMKTSGLLGTVIDDCFVPASGKAQWSDISADGATVAWADAEGLKLAAPPIYPAGVTCTFASPPVLVDTGATSPALGPIDVDTLYATRNAPAPGTQTTPTTPTAPSQPTVTVPAPGKAPTVLVPQGLAAATLLGTQGSSIQVGTGKAGAITVTVKVKASTVGRKGAQIVIATGSARAGKAGGFIVKLKPTKLGKKLKKKLRGKKVIVIISAGGKTTTKTVTLK